MNKYVCNYNGNRYYIYADSMHEATEKFMNEHSVRDINDIHIARIGRLIPRDTYVQDS